MYIYRGETGFVYNVDISGRETVEQLKAYLFKVTSVPLNDQVLLCEGQKLEKGKILEDYGIPMKDKSIFLYDKRFIDSESPPADITPPILDVKITPVPALPQNLELEKSPLHWALMKYENQFLTQLNIVEAYKRTAEMRLEFSKVCVTEQTIQMNAYKAAAINMSEHITQVIQGYNGFQSYYSQVQKRNEKLIDSFDNDIQKLREITLHNALKVNGMTTLADFIPELRLRKWREECSNEHNVLKTRVMELEKTIVSSKDSADTERKRVPEGYDPVILNDQLKKAQDIVSDLTLRSQIFAQDYKTVSQRLKEASSLKSANNKILWELCDGLEDLLKMHVQYISIFRDQDDVLRSIMHFCANSKSRLTRFLWERLRVISKLQTKSRDVANKIVLYNDILLKQKQAFHQLVYVQTMPKAYYAALDEVIRRRKFGKKVQAFISKVSDLLARIREEEKGARVAFLNKYGAYIPKDLIPGLSDGIPRLELSIPQFDVTLPQIDGDTNNNNNNNNNNNTNNTILDVDFSVLLSDSPRMTELEKENERLMHELKILKSSTAPVTMVSATSPPTPFTPDLMRLQAELLESQESAADYRKRIETLEAKLSSTYSQVEQAETLVKQLKEMYESSQFQISQMSLLQTDQLDNKVKQSYQEIDNLKDQLVAMESKLREFEEKEMSFIILKRSLEEQNLKQEKLIGDTNSENENLRKSINEYLTKLSTLEQETNEKEETIVNLKSNLEQLEEEFQQSKQQCTLLQSKTNEISQREEQLVNELSTSNQKVEDLSTKLVDMEQLITELTSELTDTKTKLRTDDARIEELIQMMKIEKDEKESLLQEKENLTNKLKDNFEEYQKLQVEIDDYKNQNEKMAKSKAELQENIIQLENSNQLLSKKLSESERKIEELSEELENSEKFTKEITHKNEELKEELLSCTARLKEIEQEKSKITEQSNDETTQIKEELEKMKKLNEELENERTQLFINLNNAENQIQVSQLKFEELSNEKSNTESQLDEKIRQQKQQIEELTNSSQNLQDEKKHLENILEKQQKKFAELEGDLKSVKSKLQEIKQEKNSLSEQYAKIQKENDLLNLKINELQTQIESLQMNNEEKSEELLKSINKYDSIVKEFNDCKNQLEKMEKSKSETNDLLVRTDDKLTSMTEEYSRMEAEAIQIGYTLTSTQDQLSKLEKEFSALQLENSTIKEKLAKSVQEYTIKAKEFSTLNDQSKQNEEKIKKLESSIVEKDREIVKSHNNIQALSQRYVEATKQLESKNRQLNDLNKQLNQVQTETHGNKEDFVKLQNQFKSQEEELKKLRELQSTLFSIVPSSDPQQDLRTRIEKLVFQREKKQVESSDSVRALEMQIEQNKEENKKQLQEIESLNEALRLAISENPRPSLAVTNFKANDWILFVWKELNKNGGCYEAYNKNSPHYYMSPIIYPNFAKEKAAHAPIMGQIVEITKNVADSSYNPFNLTKETVFYEVLITQ